MMLFFYLYANSFQSDLNKVTVDIDSIKVLDENKIDKRAHLDVRFNIQNPNSIVLTISTINYQLYANGQNLGEDRKSTRLNSSHMSISYAVFCLKKKKNIIKTSIITIK